MANVNFNFTYNGKIAQNIIYSALEQSIRGTANVMSGVKSLQQWIYDNPTSWEGLTVEESKTACGVTDLELAKPTNRTPKVTQFRIAAKRCNIELIYDDNGDYTHYADQTASGMAGLSQYGGRDATVLNLLLRGMGVDNFRRAWFSQTGNTGTFYDTEVLGLIPAIIANAAATPSFDKCYQATDLASTLTPADTIAILKELYEESFINLRMLMPNAKVFEVTPNVYYQLLGYLEGVTGSDRNFDFLLKPDGTLYYRGIEVRMVAGWEQALAGTGDLALDLAADTEAFIIYTAKDNLWALTDNEGDQARLSTFWDEDSELYKYRGRFALGTYIKEYGMTSFAKQNLVP